MASQEWRDPDAVPILREALPQSLPLNDAEQLEHIEVQSSRSGVHNGAPATIATTAAVSAAAPAASAAAVATVSEDLDVVGQAILLQWAYGRVL